MQTISATDTAAHLRLVITRSARRLRQEGGGDLTPSLTASLATIQNHGPLTPSRLADIERIKRPTVTRVLGRLEEEGLVQRAVDPSDRRICRISTTAEGRALLKKMRSRKTAYLARRLEGLSAVDLATLDRAADLLEQALLEDSPR